MKQSPNLKRGIIQIPKGLFRPLNTKRLLSALCLLSSTRSNTGANYLRLPHQRWVSLLHKTWTPQWKRWQSRRTCWWRSWCSRQWQNLCTGETKHKAAIVTPISLPYQPVTHCREACWVGGGGAAWQPFCIWRYSAVAEYIYINPALFKMAASVSCFPTFGTH